jgi:hypothetical protein
MTHNGKGLPTLPSNLMNDFSLGGWQWWQADVSGMA